MTYDGHLMWRITNVKERFSEAKCGRQVAFYSPPFFTCINGYKMCAKLYLNGDGLGLNSHVSLFFIIMRGEHDALLDWPFRQQITFMLMDQSGAKQHHADAFKPNPSSDSFKRPESDMNVASGLPQFCSLDKFLNTDHEFLKNNCMIINIKVGTQGLPKLI